MERNDSKIERCVVSKQAVLVQFRSEADIPDPNGLDVLIHQLHESTLKKMDIGGLPTKNAQARAIVIQTTEAFQGDQVFVHISGADKKVLFDGVLKVHSMLEVPDDRASELDDARRTTNAVEDAVSYAFLTEDVGGNAPATSPSARLGSPDGGAQLIGKALRDVLGWKVRDDDPKGFTGALTTSFAVQEVDGHTEWSWTPRTYAVQTDLNGGITGAQASLYKRAQEALTQSLPLLDGLYPLDPEADIEDVAAVKAVLRKQLEELVGELGAPGGPGLTRVENYFNLLLAGPVAHYNVNDKLLDPEPDHLQGTLGRLRDVLGLSFGDDLVNSVEDEQDQTNFRILADYVTSLAQSWLSNRKFFGLDTKIPFLGTQLVPISRQLSVIAESVDELRFTLDSVFIGAAERQTLKLNFGGHGRSMYAEDFFRWIQNFVTTEAPSYVQDGGKIGNSLVPFARRLQEMTNALLHTSANGQLPPGFRTARVQRSIQSLAKELQELVRLASPLKRDFAIEPPPAQLRALVDALGLAALPGVLSFDTNNLTASTTLVNLRDAPLHITSLPAGMAEIKFEAFTSDNGQSALLPPNSGVPVTITITVSQKKFNTTSVRFEGRDVAGTASAVIASTEVVLLLTS
jgi:hypothetical protein